MRSAPLKSVHRKSGLSLVFAVPAPYTQMSPSHKLLLGPALARSYSLGNVPIAVGQIKLLLSRIADAVPPNPFPKY